VCGLGVRVQGVGSGFIVEGIGFAVKGCMLGVHD
jgi:hypothetical protein